MISLLPFQPGYHKKKSISCLFLGITLLQSGKARWRIMMSTDPRIKHLRWTFGEDDSQCHPRTVANDSLFLSIKATVCNVASDPWGHRTPWHQAQYHVMVSLSRALINTRKRDHGQSCAHYHSSLRGLVCLFTDVGKRMQAGQIRGKKKNQRKMNKWDGEWM